MQAKRQAQTYTDIRKSHGKHRASATAKRKPERTDKLYATYFFICVFLLCCPDTSLQGANVDTCKTWNGYEFD
jgi:hypothetical protein